MELSIDTATRYASVAISSEGEMVMELSWRSAQNHSVELVPAIRRIMEQAGVAMDDLDGIVVARGPGGFSALRVGISVAKSLAEARQVPLAAVGTLEIEAQPYLGLGLPVCALIEAGRSKVYAGTFDGSNGATVGRGADYTVETHEGLVASTQRQTLFCGEAAGAMATTLHEGLGDLALLADLRPPTRRPAVLAGLGYARLAVLDTDDPATLEPTYMRGAQVQMAHSLAKEGR